jgi:hypothetical protein
MAIWYGGIAAFKVVHYIRLDAESPATHIHWTVRDLDTDQYVLEGEYTFQSNGKEYAGKSIIERPYYRNIWAAVQAIKEQTNTQWFISYSSINPNFSSLQKSFPLRECLSFLFLCGLLAYFVFLNYYVNHIVWKKVTK